MKTDTKYLFIPGYGNSDKDHWQTSFEKHLPNSLRIEQKSWDHPVCEDWVKAIQDTMQKYDADSIVLVSHSMGGIAIAHWAARYKTKIKGAFIVAPPDLENPYTDLGLNSFTPIPVIKFPFPSMVIASSNDNWATVQRTQTFANHWGSKLIIIGDAGHINSSAGYGEWKEGLKLLKEFAGEVG